MSQAPSQRHPVEILQEFSLPLIAGVVLALIWANVSPESYHHTVHASLITGGHFNLHFVMNDLFMALFFGLAAKEITESCLPGGALNPPRKAVNPLFGTVGGVLGPIAVYLLYAHFSGAEDIKSGWGIPTATDIALAWLVARMIFGKGHPAVSFLLLLAVADDGLGLGIIAIFYPDPAHPVQPAYLALVGAAVAGAYILRKKNVKSFWPYLLVPGVLSWAGLYLAHLHPALALVPIVPFMPNMGHDEGLFAEMSNGLEHHDTLNRFEHFFKLPVDLGLFGFGLANAGVELSSIGAGTTAVLLGLLVGKTVGIFSFSMLADRLGFALPEGMDWRSLVTVGLVAGLGLTVALFVAGVAFTDPALQGAAKMGALMSAFVAPVALVVGRILKVKRAVPVAQNATPNVAEALVPIGSRSIDIPR